MLSLPQAFFDWTGCVYVCTANFSAQQLIYLSVTD
jgi:hypothetical protein